MTHVTRILSTTDFSEQSRHAMDYAVALARSWSARLTVLHVHQLAPPLLAGPYLGSESALPVSLTPDERRELSQAMASFVASDRSAGVEVETRLQEDFLVPRAILECAAAEQAGLVVLGTHGRSGFERLALGSVAERVLRTSVVPVLTVPPRAGGADRRAPLAIQAVVCPLDFGPSSAGALDMAASLAERTRAGLTVVHVVDLADDLVVELDILFQAGALLVDLAGALLVGPEIRLSYLFLKLAEGTLLRFRVKETSGLPRCGFLPVRISQLILRASVILHATNSATPTQSAFKYANTSPYSV